MVRIIFLENFSSHSRQESKFIFHSSFPTHNDTQTPGNLFLGSSPPFKSLCQIAIYFHDILFAWMTAMVFPFACLFYLQHIFYIAVRAIQNSQITDSVVTCFQKLLTAYHTKFNLFS